MVFGSKLRVACLAGLLAGLTSPVQADFVWFNTVTNRITYAGGGSNYLVGSSNDPAAACFVQLIYAGANGNPDAAADTGTGVSGDDVVVSNLWVGARVTGDAGRVNGGTFSEGDVVGFYFVRLWTAPTPDFPAGTVPASPTNFYGDSALFFNSCTGGICLPGNFDFGGAGGFATLSRPRSADSDGDGMPDWWEVLHFGGPTNATAGVDDDGDGHSNWQEFVADTQPTNDLSALEFTVVQPSATPTGVVVRWTAVDGRLYDVRRGTNIAALSTALASNIVAVAPSMSFTDTTAGAEAEFYGLGVK